MLERQLRYGKCGSVRLCLLCELFTIAAPGSLWLSLKITFETQSAELSFQMNAI